MKTELAATMLDKTGSLTRTTVSSMFRIKRIELIQIHSLYSSRLQIIQFILIAKIFVDIYHIYMKDLKVEN